MLNALHAGAEASAVVKANAYGHGAAEVSKALSKAGCTTFFVAYAGEGVIVRDAVGLEARIFVLNGPRTEDLPLYESSALCGVLNTAAQVELWFKGRVKRPFALKFDTGMNRLGLPTSEAGALTDAGTDLPPALVMSHLAYADDADNPMNSRQLEAFRGVLTCFPGVLASLSNSAGCFLGPDFAFDLTRPGIALYGGGGHGVQPGITLTAEILSVHDGRAGETVGYGATHQLTEDTPLATVALGYGDGFLRSGSNAGFGVLKGARCPIVGRISMDLITLDMSAVVGKAQAGDHVEFLGAAAPLDEQAAQAGTIGYELVTGLGPRVERTYER